MESILDVQHVLYEGAVTAGDNSRKRPCSSSSDNSSSSNKVLLGPPMLPHGDDPAAVRPRKKRKPVTDKYTHIPVSNLRLVNESEQEFAASTLPAGFPPELSFRALAAYSLLRTLSIELRLSPFTPTAFLRALYLPLPNRLLGKVHVALLRILLRHLRMGYHWGEDASKPPLDILKKRKDGLRWPLRASDNLQLLDTYTWPVFFDDYCHLTADVLYASMHSHELYVDEANLDVSRISMADYDSDEDDDGRKMSSSRIKSIPQQQRISVIYMRDTANAEDSDGEWAVDSQALDDDPDDELYEGTTASRRPSLGKKKQQHYQHPRPQKLPPSSGPPAMNFYSHVPSVEALKARDVIFNHHQRPSCSSSAADLVKSPMTATNSTSYGVPTTMSQPRASATAIPAASRVQALHPFWPSWGMVPNDALHAAAMPSTAAQQPQQPPMVHSSVLPGALRRGNNITSVEGSDLFPATVPNVANGAVPATDTTATTAAQQPLLRPVQSSSNDVSLTASQLSPLPTPVIRDGEVPRKPPSVSANASLVLQSERPVGDRTRNPAKLLRLYIQGKELPIDDIRTVGSTDSSDTTDSADDHDPELSPNEHWPQFRPLRRMRTGTPYHHLRLEEKLDILEFLIDQLLEVGEIAEEMTKREFATGHFPVPFGKLPLPSELEQMENEDWCAVCRKEGDLLCCDGCVASYHGACMGFPKDYVIPDGKWFCPECTIADPAMFGPLRGGRRSSIPWCDSVTLDNCSRFQLPINGESAGDICGHSARTASIMANSMETQDEDQYLCVYGYVCCRKKRQESQDAAQVLLPESLRVHLASLGAQICSSWPMAQIPLNHSELRSKTGLHSGNGFRHLQHFEYYNPCLYDNKYKAAPLHTLAGSHNDAHTCDYESKCCSASMYKLNDCLRNDMSNDEFICKSLRSSLRLFNPYTMISSYMLELEQKLSKASLLQAYWVTGRRSVAWKQRTGSCRSLHKLAALLVALSDVIHPKAFCEGWFACTRKKGALHTGSGAEPIPEVADDADLKVLSRRRHWRTCPISAISSLLSRERRSLHDWFVESLSDLTPVVQRHKRKRDLSSFEQEGFETQLDGASIGELATGISDSVGIRPSLQGEVFENGGSEVPSPPSKKLRTRSRQLPTYASCLRDVDRAKKCGNALDRKHKMSEVVKGLAEQVVPEGRWPVAGRRLFKPVGNLPTPHVRYLARNSGCVVAPFVNYVEGYEVGQVAVCHVWRKSVSTCTSFEELLMHVRIFEAHIDKALVRRGGTLSLRFNSGKNVPQSAVLCSQRDLSTALEYHLVKKIRQGSCSWVSSTKIELPTLIANQLLRYKMTVTTTKSKPSYFAVPVVAKIPTKTERGQVKSDLLPPKKNNQPFLPQTESNISPTSVTVKNDLRTTAQLEARPHIAATLCATNGTNDLQMKQIFPTETYRPLPQPHDVARLGDLSAYMTSTASASLASTQANGQLLDMNQQFSPAQIMGLDYLSIQYLLGALPPLHSQAPGHASPQIGFNNLQGQTNCLHSQAPGHAAPQIGFNNLQDQTNGLYSQAPGHAASKIGFNNLQDPTTGLYSLAPGHAAPQIGFNNLQDPTNGLYSRAPGHSVPLNGFNNLQDQINGLYSQASGHAAFQSVFNNLQGQTYGLHSQAPGHALQSGFDNLQNPTNGLYSQPVAKSQEFAYAAPQNRVGQNEFTDNLQGRTSGLYSQSATNSLDFAYTAPGYTASQSGNKTLRDQTESRDFANPAHGHTASQSGMAGIAVGGPKQNPASNEQGLNRLQQEYSASTYQYTAPMYGYATSPPAPAPGISGLYTLPDQQPTPWTTQEHTQPSYQLELSLSPNSPGYQQSYTAPAAYYHSPASAQVDSGPAESLQTPQFLQGFQQGYARATYQAPTSAQSTMQYTQNGQFTQNDQGYLQSHSMPTDYYQQAPATSGLSHDPGLAASQLQGMEYRQSVQQWPGAVQGYAATTYQVARTNCGLGYPGQQPGYHAREH